MRIFKIKAVWNYNTFNNENNIDQTVQRLITYEGITLVFWNFPEFRGYMIDTKIKVDMKAVNMVKKPTWTEYHINDLNAIEINFELQTKLGKFIKFQTKNTEVKDVLDGIDNVSKINERLGIVINLLENVFTAEEINQLLEYYLSKRVK